MKLPTVEDVARSAQVSRQTVSNVLNAPSVVREATRTRVEAAIAELGYRPNLSARRLRQQKSATIGIRLDPQRNGISGGILDRFVHALTEQADARAMRVLLFTADGPSSEIEQIRRLRDGADVDAFVLTATFHCDPRTEWLIENRIPFVTFGRPWGIDDMNDPRHRWVDIDGRKGVYDATIHLLDSGARRIGWLGWPRPSGTGDDRRRGWEDAMRDSLGTSDDELVALSTESFDGVPQASDAIARRLQTQQMLDGLVCASDTLALGAMIAVASAPGLADLPIIGFDNTPVAEAVGLSSVEQPLDLVAAGALELLLGPLGDSVIPRQPSVAPQHRLIPPVLMMRKTNHLPLYGTTRTTTDAAGNHNRKETS